MLKDGNVGHRLQGFRKRLLTVRGFCDHLAMRVVLQYPTDAGPDNFVVVGDKNSDAIHEFSQMPPRVTL
jgi:hypothetical protein